MLSPPTTHGFVRTVSRSLAHCELLHVARGVFDVERARQQHAGYVEALVAAGVSITVLPEEPELPDATFLEDTMVMLDEVTVLCRPGKPIRQPEVDHLEALVGRARPFRRIAAPGTLEGGDVLRVGRTLYVGLSTRTNPEGIRQLEQAVAPWNYSVRVVPVSGCLHLKTGATSPGERLLLANAAWVDVNAFQNLEILPVPADEPWGANTLAVNRTVLVAASTPRTADLLGTAGLQVHRLDISELQKAEAGLTCLSVLFRSEAEC